MILRLVRRLVRPERGGNSKQIRQGVTNCYGLWRENAHNAAMSTATSSPQAKLLTLSQEDIEFYHANGYLHVKGVYSQDEVGRLNAELEEAAADWGILGGGWKSPGNDGKSKVLVMHRLEYYSPAWDQARASKKMVDVAQDLLGPNVEYIGSSTHTKPGQHGGAFPMHQDSLFYGHATPDLLICMVHLDDTYEANGPISFIPRPVAELRHIPHTKETDPENGGPYMDPDEFKLEDAVSVDCKAGDVVIFNIFTIHGSGRNNTDAPRRAVVFRYRDPENKQVVGENGPFTNNREGFGIMARGKRPPIEGMCAAPGGEINAPQPRSHYGG